MKRYPGKFEGCIDQRLGKQLYQATLNNWCDDEFGDVSDGSGWHGLIYRETRKTSYAVHEDSQGFFDYEAIPTLEIMALWEAFQAENKENEEE